ncbi:protein kinase [Candidatus Saccharibacteria bacterium]|nr:protein kinase [Candidatus Saccharibacteria bacterium]
MSPEQALGKSIDHRADIYALGLVFYETLTGKRVYTFSSDIDAIRAIPKMDIEPVSNSVPEVHEELNRIIMKCLEKQKDNRYQSAAEVYTDLMAFKKEQKLAFEAYDLANFMKKNFKTDEYPSQSK